MQTTSVFLPWELHEQFEKFLANQKRRRTDVSSDCALHEWNKYSQKIIKQRTSRKYTKIYPLKNNSNFSFCIMKIDHYLKCTYNLIGKIDHYLKIWGLDHNKMNIYHISNWWYVFIWIIFFNYINHIY